MKIAPIKTSLTSPFRTTEKRHNSSSGIKDSFNSKVFDTFEKTSFGRSIQKNEADIPVEEIKKAGSVFLDTLCSAEKNDKHFPVLYDESYKAYLDEVFNRKEFLTSSDKFIHSMRHDLMNMASAPLALTALKLKTGKKVDPIFEAKTVVASVNTTVKLYRDFMNEGYEDKQYTSLDYFTNSLKASESLYLQKNIEICVDEDSLDLLATSSGSPSQFIIMNNLIGNAVKYSPNDSTVKISFSSTVDKKEYSFGSYDVKAVYITVEDEGIGIEEEDKKRIFLKGERGRNVGDIHGGGSGMDYVYKLTDGHVKITSPLYPEKKFKGTRVEARIFTT